MTQITIDLQTLQQQLSLAASRNLPLVQLQPYIPTSGSYAYHEQKYDTPAVMGWWEPIDDLTYVFRYKDIRFFRLGYILERDGVYKVGELSVLSDLVAPTSSPPSSEPTPPPVPTPPTPPTLTVVDTVIIPGLVGVDLSFQYLPETAQSVYDMRFTLSYKITTAIPAVFPTIRCFVIASVPLSS